MPGKQNSGPQYLSPHSAETILSDVRPVKLKIEALQSINVFLDEFLYLILATARSLVSDKLRAGLLKILPTALGKEALLEAEVELRAYWDRTKTSRPAPDEDKDTFSLEWSFELLRLKCEAYSTLNEGDEDPDAEARLQKRMAPSGLQPPKEILLAPAALYLTAILESICEHILSNVGRVASRDSSRSSATTQDLFVALCEDDTVYSLFKAMKVYEQIEQLSKTPAPRRSKSFSRNSTSHQDASSINGASGLSRQSSELNAPTSSRPSMEKGRSSKKFVRASGDLDRDGHKRSDSALSESTKVSLNQRHPSYEDADSQEFDNLMRSEQTMKVSLTPDRLKTMEAYKQEKDQRGSRRPSPLLSPKTDPNLPSLPPSRPNGRAPRNVDAIVEDEEDAARHISGRPRQASLSSAHVPGFAESRSRSHSTSSPLVNSQGSNQRLLKRPSKTSVPVPSPSLPPMSPARDFGGVKPPVQAFPGPDGLPQKRNRKKQLNRESLDLDDVMAGSGDEQELDAPPAPYKEPRTPNRPKYAVSASTRELMNFLEEGPPPQPGVSKAGQDLIRFLDDGPPPEIGGGGFNGGMDNARGKGSGRLQRMISKLSIGGEKGKEELTRRPSGTPTRSNIPSKASAGNLSSLANRPIPPRPRPISPPSSPSSEESSKPPARPRYDSESRIHPPPSSLSPVLPRKISEQYMNGKSEPVPESPKGPRPARNHPHHIITSEPSRRQGTPVTQKPAAAPPVVSHILAKDAIEVRRLMAKATTLDECRLILDMFLARAGSPLEQSTSEEVPYPSPSLSEQPDKPSGLQTPPPEVNLEAAILELLLSGEATSEPRKKRVIVKRKPTPKIAIVQDDLKAAGSPIGHRKEITV